MSYVSRPATWLDKALLAVAGVALLFLALFFLAAAAVAGTVLALVIAARGWWLGRRLRRQSPSETIEGQYTVVEHARLESYERTKRD